MTRTICMLFMATMVMFSCSSDKLDETTAASLLGTWDLTALEIDEAMASDAEQMGQDILTYLTARECYIVSFTFNEDMSMDVEDATNYVQINVNPIGLGLEVPCPEQRDNYSSTYTYENGIVTFIDDSQETVSVRINISGNTLTLAAEELQVDNFNTGGLLVFTKR